MLLFFILFLALGATLASAFTFVLKSGPQVIAQNIAGWTIQIGDLEFRDGRGQTINGVKDFLMEKLTIRESPPQDLFSHSIFPISVRIIENSMQRFPSVQLRSDTDAAAVAFRGQPLIVTKLHLPECNVNNQDDCIDNDNKKIYIKKYILDQVDLADPSLVGSPASYQRTGSTLAGGAFSATKK